MKPENIFKEKLVSRLENENLNLMTIKHNDRNNIGFPDIQILFNNKSYFWEIKYINRFFSDFRDSDFKHPFSKKQYLWAVKAKRKKVVSVGIVGFKDIVFIIPLYLMKKGKMKKKELDTCYNFSIDHITPDSIIGILKKCEELAELPCLIKDILVEMA
jgi:hypothetical protein